MHRSRRFLFPWTKAERCLCTTVCFRHSRPFGPPPDRRPAVCERSFPTPPVPPSNPSHTPSIPCLPLTPHN